MVTLGTAALSAWAGLALLAPPRPQGEVRVEVPAVYGFLPVRVFAGTRASAEGVLGALREGLRARGARVVPDVVVEDALREGRIRQTDSLSAESAAVLERATGARFLVTATLLDHAGAPEPRLSVLVRLVDAREGRRALSSLVALRGEDFRGLLGLGAISDPVELAREAAARILDDFDPAGWPARRADADLGDARPSDALTSYRDEDLELGPSARLVVLPFANRTRRNEVGRVFAALVGHEWFRSAGVDVVENAELRSTLVRLGVRTLEYLGEETLREIGDDLGARYFVLGSVDRYRAGVFRNGFLTPEVEASARLLDVRTGRLVAAASVLRRGSDYHTILGLGTVDDLTSLAGRVAHELVALMAVSP